MKSRDMKHHGMETRGTKRRSPKKTDDSMLDQLATEQPNPASADLDLKSSLEIAKIVNAEDATVAAVVRRALPEIARGIDWIAAALSSGGRLIYVGTGTSGRLAALDAAECPPTFNTDPKLVQFVMAGGARALSASVEADEDSRALGVREIRKRKPNRKDVVVGVAASGRTPFTIAAVEYSRSRGAKTIAVTCNPDSALEKAAELGIVVETGPEVVSGSTRMKAGTAEKMVLNMLSTGAMVRMGYVYGNLMVNLHQKNSKLAARAVTILERALRVDRSQARKALKSSGGNVPVAIVMHAAGVNRKEAQGTLKSAKGHVRRAIERANVKKQPL
jgi:N-acetylmuramic acid 6-phosphate etherase